MQNECRLSIATQPDVREHIHNAAEDLNYSPSRVAHLILQSFKNVDIKKYLELYQGQALVGFDISKLVNALVLDRYPTPHNQQQV